MLWLIPSLAVSRVHSNYEQSYIINKGRLRLRSDSFLKEFNILLSIWYICIKRKVCVYITYT